MKLKPIMGLGAAVVCICLGHAALANQVTLLNTSPDHQSLELIYKVAHKNAGGETVFSAPHSINLQHDQVIPVGMEDYQLAGVVVMSIEGHLLPRDANEFGKPHRCSFATSKEQPSGLIAITFVKKADGHGSISCAVNGEVAGQ